MEVVLVRHGESVANAEGLIQGRGDYRLSERGREQARLTAEALAGFEPGLIYTSPLARAGETAEIINRSHQCEVSVLEELIEYNLGSFEGLTPKQVLDLVPDLEEQMKGGTPFHHLAPGAETDQEVDRRAAGALLKIMGCGLDRVIVVSHLGILERMIKIVAEKFEIADPSVLKGRMFPLLNCSITRMFFEEKRASIVVINDVSHLAGLGR